MKILLSVLMLMIGPYIYNPIYNDLIDVYVSEELRIENDIIKVVDDKVSFYFNDNYLFSLKFEEANLENVFDNFDYLVLNDEINIVIKQENSIRYLKYNDLGQKLIEKEYNNILNVSKLKIFYDDNYLNIIFSAYYTSDEEHLYSNIYIMKTDEKGNSLGIKTYGGVLNEFLIDCYFHNNQLYLFIQRDNMSGGDFNNHGNYVLSIIKDEEVVKNLYFNNQKFQNILFGEEEIRVSFLDAIYGFDYDFNQIIGTKIALESLCLLTSINKMYMKIFEKEVIIFDINTNEELFKYDISHLNNSYFLKYFKIIDDSIYLCFSNMRNDKFIKIDAFDTRDFVSDINYLDGISQYNNSIEAWSRNITTSANFEEFDSSIDGKYEIKYSFSNYFKVMTVNVFEYQNVSEGGVYPLAYSLNFSGTAFLNGKLINYGYVINEVGEYKLEIYNSNRVKREINFTVSKNQIYFSSQINKKSDFVIEKNQSLYLKYFVNNLEEYEIEEVIINGKSYKNYNLKNNVLTIEIFELESGFKYYYIDKIVFKDKLENVYEEVINDIVSVVVLNAEPNIYLSFEENKKEVILNYQIDSGESVRYINVYNENQFFKKIDFKDGDISGKFDLNLRNVSFSLVYELGDGTLYETELFTLVYDDETLYDIAYLNVSILDNDVKNFSISISKNSKLRQIIIKDKQIYEQENENNLLLYCAIFSLMFVLIIILISFLKHKKKKNTFKDNNTFKKNEIMI